MDKEIRTHEGVPKRAKNSITINLNKLIKKYGEKSVRLVTMKLLSNISNKTKLEKEIEEREEELKRLKKLK